MNESPAIQCPDIGSFPFLDYSNPTGETSDPLSHTLVKPTSLDGIHNTYHPYMLETRTNSCHRMPASRPRE